MSTSSLRVVSRPGGWSTSPTAKTKSPVARGVREGPAISFVAEISERCRRFTSYRLVACPPFPERTAEPIPTPNFYPVPFSTPPPLKTLGFWDPGKSHSAVAPHRDGFLSRTVKNITTFPSPTRRQTVFAVDESVLRYRTTTTLKR